MYTQPILRLDFCLFSFWNAGGIFKLTPTILLIGLNHWSLSCLLLRKIQQDNNHSYLLLHIWKCIFGHHFFYQEIIYTVYNLGPKLTCYYILGFSSHGYVLWGSFVFCFKIKYIVTLYLSFTLLTLQLYIFTPNQNQFSKTTNIITNLLYLATCTIVPYAS